MNEIWKDIPNYEGVYQVSNLGKVKSLNYNRTKVEKIMLLTLNRYGYYAIGLSKNNKKKTFTVHKLVAMAFLGHTPCGYKLVVDHIDSNPLNNNLENLQLISQRENSYRQQGKHSSSYKGVYWSKQLNKWRACITINNKQTHLGCFINEYDAHLAYQNKLKEIQ